MPEPEIVDTLRALVREAVRRQMRADVPVGVFLSGGIDSSAISYFATRELERPVETFAVGFEQPEFDETRQALRASAALGTRHTTTVLSDTLAADALRQIASRLDEPIGDSSLVCTYALCEAARTRVIVALGGEGADELFGGYDPFRVLHLARLYSRVMPRPVHRAIRLLAARLPNRPGYMTGPYRLTRMLRGLTYGPPLWNPAWIGPLDPGDLAQCFDQADSLESVYSEAIELWDSCRACDLVERTRLFFVKLYLQDDILAKVDRAGMMNSLEVRTPFLDLDLVEFVCRLPSSLIHRRGRTKYVFKEAMRPLLPSWIIDQPKHGFAVPMASWLKQDRLPLDLTALPPGIRAPFVERSIAAHRKGRENNSVFLWSLWLLMQTMRTRSDS